MKSKIDWLRIAYITGVVLLIIGIVDPLEGSILVAAGSILIAFATYFKNDSHWKVFLTGSVMIVVGVSFLFFLSSLGGFGGNSSRSWWWGLLIIPYPLGWLLCIIILILRTFRKPVSPITK